MNSMYQDPDSPCSEKLVEKKTCLRYEISLKKDSIKEKALKKLSKEEKKALGIK